MKSFSNVIKVVQIGDPQTGKSSLYLRHHKGEFVDSPFNLGVDFYSKIVELGEEQIKIYFWDYHTNERVSSITRNYYKQCSVVMISYDITNRQSFDRIQSWFNDYYQKKQNKEAILALIGNKCDLEQQRQVSYLEGQQLAKSLGMIFFEVSAKTGYQINELFECLISNAINIQN
ncbi:hypothetical protein ABPG74_013200 [Tetrahymena malaccensis]